jgi:hypothetical protein
MKITVLSPDRIPISPRPFKTLESADRAIAKWIKGFELQGFYSCSATGYERIPLDKLPGRMTKVIE